MNNTQDQNDKNHITNTNILHNITSNSLIIVRLTGC
jgi:hypothetical protein